MGKFVGILLRGDCIDLNLSDCAGVLSGEKNKIMAGYVY